MPAFEKGHARVGGRVKGTPNRVAANIREICQKAAPECVAELLRLALHGKHEMTRIAATREILDRGFGRAKQTLEGELMVGISAELAVLLQRHDGQSRSIPLRATDNSDADSKSLPAPNGDGKRYDVN